MITRFWHLFRPFQRQFGLFAFILVIYETVQILEAYTISLVIRFFAIQIDSMVWIGIVIGLLIWDELFMRLDNALDWHIITRILYPIYRFIKLSAAAKFFELSLPWHERHNSGALVEKVNSGADKVDNTVNDISWEFLPTIIQTVLSLIPLTVISPIASMIAAFAFSVFLFQSIQLSKRLQPLRKARFDLYEEEGHKSVEMVQTVETIVMFDQTDRIMREHQALLDKIADLGTQEARIGIYQYNRRRIRILSISRRLILGIWIWQLHQGTLDIANLIFVNVLVEKLFHSFWRFARLFDRASEASEGAKRLIDLLETPSDTTWRKSELPHPTR